MNNNAFTSYYKYEFNGRIQKYPVGINKRGELFYTVIFLPDELISILPVKQYPRLRVDGEIHNLPFQGALQPSKGRYYLLLSQRFLKENELNQGDDIEVRFNIGDQDHVEIPTELEQALRQQSEAKAPWDSFTPGKKARLCNHRCFSKKSGNAASKSSKDNPVHFGRKKSGWTVSLQLTP